MRFLAATLFLLVGLFVSFRGKLKNHNYDKTEVFGKITVANVKNVFYIDIVKYTIYVKHVPDGCSEVGVELRYIFEEKFLGLSLCLVVKGSYIFSGYLKRVWG